MKKLNLVMLLAVAATFLLAAAPRGAFNRTKSVVVNAASTTIPTAFSNASGSLVMQNLSSGNYSHILVINETNAPVSILMLPDVSSAPAASVTSQRLHVVSSGVVAYDDISIFDNLYIQSEENAIATKKVRITVW